MKIIFIFVLMVSSYSFSYGNLCVKAKLNTRGLLKKSKFKVDVKKGQYYLALKKSKNKKYLLVQSPAGAMWVSKKSFIKAQKGFCASALIMGEEDSEISLDNRNQNSEPIVIKEKDKNQWSEKDPFGRQEDEVLSNKESVNEIEENKNLISTDKKSYWRFDLSYSMSNNPKFLKPLLVDIGDPNDVSSVAIADPIVRTVNSSSGYALALSYEWSLLDPWLLALGLSYSTKNYTFNFYDKPDTPSGAVPLSSLTEQEQKVTQNFVGLKLDNTYLLFGDWQSLHLSLNLGLEINYNLSEYTHNFKLNNSNQTKSVATEDISFYLYSGGSLGWKWMFVDVNFALDKDFDIENLQFDLGFRF